MASRPLPETGHRPQTVSLPNSAGRRAFAVAALVVAAASVSQHARQARLSAEAERFTRRFTLDQRRPAALTLLPVQPSGDLTADVVVSAALADAAGEPEEGEPGALPQLPARSVTGGRLAEELSAARDLMLQAVRARPGWASHRFLLGRVAHAIEKSSPARGRRPELWSTPLALAAWSAPGRDEIWTTLGDAYLASWADLPASMRERSVAVFARALENAAFVSRSFVRTVEALGQDEAMHLLPDRSGVLREAARSLAWQGDLEGAARIFDRMDRAERGERAEDLRRIERRRRLGDLEGLRAVCFDWTRRHPTGSFDDPAGRAEVARVLELWPQDRPGSWKRDPRAEMVRFFLRGRQADASPKTLLRALESLAGAPEAVRARVLLLAGDLSAAERLRRASSGSDPAWTAYFVERAKLELEGGRTAEARAAIQRVSPPDRNACDVLLIRREVARSLGDDGELEAVRHGLEDLRTSSDPGDGWSPEPGLSLCLDPDRTEGRQLQVEIAADEPSIVSYGWEGARSGTILVHRSARLVLPLRGLAGRRTLTVQSVAGGSGLRLRAVGRGEAPRSNDLGSPP